MFVLALMENIVRIKPHEMDSPLEEVITFRLNEQLSNRVIPGVGLCIFVHDLLEIGDSYILPGDGSSHTRVKFRFVVFRPFVEEVIEAKVLSSNSEGLTLSVKFFEDIFIAKDKLPQPSLFEEEEQIWYWEYPSEDGQPPAKLYMDPGKVVRFRVLENIFRDVDPIVSQEEAKKEKSYEIIGSMVELGLGCTAWWTSDEDGGGDEDEEEEAADEEMQGE